ncbi:MAG: TAT-variant-translocated molybdopterin oxidoreductase, partial [Bdellovibrionota bacterium]
MNETTPTHKYWQSLEDWRNDSEFQKLAEQEFLTSPIREASGSTDSSEGGWARREFLKLMGASLALTSFGCVRRPAEKIVPYVKKPKEIIEGIANYYSSSWNDGSEVFGLVVKTREGRPVKVEGNPSHPLNQGGMSARAHAHILSLYDPDRLSAPVRHLFNEARTNSDSVSTSFEKADAAIGEQLKKGGVAVLTSSIVSPSLNNALGEFKSAFSARQYTWDVMGAEKMARGQEISYGSSLVPRFRFDKAKMIVSAGADFLGTYISPTEHQNAFSKMRNPDGEMNKLVVFEPLLTLTGANADFRARVRPSHVADVLLGLMHELAANQKVTRYAGDSSVLNTLKPYADIAGVIGLSPEVFAEIAKELYENRGQSIVIAGEDLRAQVAANLLNSALGNDGVTIDYRNAHTGFQGSSQDLSKLVTDIKAGTVKTLIIHGMNAIHAAPENLGLAEALRKVEMVIYTGSHTDDTGKMAEYILSDSHSMEAWGDAEGQKGIYSIQQPTIQPMGQTRPFGETLLSIMKAAGRSVKTTSWYEYVRATAAARGASGDAGWENLLEKGVIETSGRDGSSAGRSVSGSALSILDATRSPLADFELVLYPTVGLRNGTLANVS